MESLRRFISGAKLGILKQEQEYPSNELLLVLGSRLLALGSKFFCLLFNKGARHYVANRTFGNWPGVGKISSAVIVVNEAER